MRQTEENISKEVSRRSWGVIGTESSPKGEGSWRSSESVFGIDETRLEWRFDSPNRSLNRCAMTLEEEEEEEEVVPYFGFIRIYISL